MRSVVSIVVSAALISCAPSSTPDVPDAGGSDAGPDDWRWSLTVLPVEGASYVQAMSLTDDGVVLAQAGVNEWDPVSDPVRLSAGGVESLSIPERNWGYVHGGLGDTFVGEFHWTPQRWRGDTRTTLPIPEGWGSAVARAVNASGLIVGSYRDYDDSLATEPGPRPCAWTSEDRFKELAHDAGADAMGAARAVNAAGRIVGFVRYSQGTRAVSWSDVDATASTYPIPEGAAGTEAYGMNSLGDAAGRAVFGSVTSRAVLFPHDGPAEVLSSPGGEEAYAEAFDLDDGLRVVGTARMGDSGAHGVLWFRGLLIDLNDRASNIPEGFKITRAVGIDSQGRIAVQLVKPVGVEQVGVVGLLVPVH